MNFCQLNMESQNQNRTGTIFLEFYYRIYPFLAVWPEESCDFPQWKHKMLCIYMHFKQKVLKFLKYLCDFGDQIWNFSMANKEGQKGHDYRNGNLELRKVYF